MKCKICEVESCGTNCSPGCTNKVHNTPAKINGLCYDCHYYNVKADANEKQYITSIDRALGYCDD